MSLQNPRVFNASIASAASLSSGIDLGGGYLYTSIEIPSSGAVPAFDNGGGQPLFIQGSSDNINFRRVFEIYTNTVASAYSIQSSVCNALIPLNLFNFRYIKLEVSGSVTGAATGGVAYKVICTDSL